MKATTEKKSDNTENINLETLHNQCLKNVTQYPIIGETLAQRLNISNDAIEKLQIGFYPLQNCWTVPEKDSEGNITAILKRYWDDKKFIHPGGKRGLYYQADINFNQKQTYEPGPDNWERSTKEFPCPICGKSGECLLSKENLKDPQAVYCAHKPIGAFRRCKNGWLHIRKPEGRISTSNSNGAILICEGHSDTLYGLTLGFTTIGIPAAGVGIDLLKPLVSGQRIIIFGDNNEAGQCSLETIFQTLQPICSSVTKILPPNPHSDLRSWKPTRTEFDLYVREYGIRKSDTHTVFTTSARSLALKWLQTQTDEEGTPTFRDMYGGWYRWNGFCYRPVHDKKLTEEHFTFLESCKLRVNKDGEIEMRSLNNIATKRQIEDMKYALSACYVDTEKLIEPEFCIAFRNGILDVQTNKIRPLTPKDLLISVLPFDYNPNAKCPNWIYFVNDIFNADQESIDLLSEWSGYLLIPSNRFQAMMFFYGGKAAGKTTTIKVLQEILGERHFPIDLESFISQFGLQPLIGKLALFVDEDKPVRKSDNARVVNRIKKISGGDRIEIRRKYKDTINIKPIFRITYSANLLPPLSDISGALMRRINLLHFPNDYSANPDRSLEEKLIAEVPGIAAWCVEGLKRLLKKEDFTIPQASKAYLQEYEQLTNPLKKLLDEHCEIVDSRTNPDVWVTTKELYDLVSIFFREQGEEHISDSQLGLQLMSILGSNPKERRSEGSGKNRKRFHVYRGIRILESGKEILINARN